MSTIFWIPELIFALLPTLPPSPAPSRPPDPPHLIQLIFLGPSVRQSVSPSVRQSVRWGDTPVRSQLKATRGQMTIRCSRKPARQIKIYLNMLTHLHFFLCHQRPAPYTETIWQLTQILIARLGFVMGGNGANQNKFINCNFLYINL